MNKLGEFETQVYEQMIAEYPDMEKEGQVFTYTHNGMTFEGAEQVTYFLCHRMWDAFDEALDYIEDKGESYGED